MIFSRIRKHGAQDDDAADDDDEEEEEEQEEEKQDHDEDDDGDGGGDDDDAGGDYGLIVQRSVFECSKLWNLLSSNSHNPNFVHLM